MNLENLILILLRENFHILWFCLRDQATYFVKVVLRNILTKVLSFFILISPLFICSLLCIAVIDVFTSFDDINPISNFTGNLVLEFVDYKLDMDNIKYSVEECKERDSTYAAPLKVSVRLTNNDTGEIKEQEVFMGDFPLMTEQGTFIINGAERVVVSQLDHQVFITVTQLIRAVRNYLLQL